MQSGVYVIRNGADGKVYVGSSLSLKRRLYLHRYRLRRGEHHNRHLQFAFNRDGEAAFSFEVLEITPDPSIRLSREQYWIDTLRAADGKRGYNLCPVAGTREGSPQPASVAVNQSLRMKGKPKSLEHRAKIAAAQVGKIISPEQRIVAAENTRRWFAEHPEARAACGDRFRGKQPAHAGRHLSEATRALISAAAKRRAADPAYRAELRQMAVRGAAAAADAIRGKPRSAEHRARISAAKKGKRLSAEHCAKIAAAGRGRAVSDETREKRCATMIATLARKRAARAAEASPAP